MLDEESSVISAWVLGNGLTPKARLRIYRNIVHNNHAAALRTAYPVVLKLVGEDFFENAAARYLRDYPTRSGNLQDYGSNYAEFLAKMPEASGLAYLPDVAQLEWARQESYLADCTCSYIQARGCCHQSIRFWISGISANNLQLNIWSFQANNNVSCCGVMEPRSLCRKWMRVPMH